MQAEGRGQLGKKLKVKEVGRSLGPAVGGQEQRAVEAKVAKRLCIRPARKLMSVCEPALLYLHPSPGWLLNYRAATGHCPEGEESQGTMPGSCQAAELWGLGLWSIVEAAWGKARTPQLTKWAW